MPFKQIPPIYHVWRSMKDRCLNPRAKAFPDYGGRGVSVCPRWVSSYAAFASDMGERPDGFSLDRIDNDLGYSPENCRWADRKTQQRNRRLAVFVVIEGVKHRAISLSEMSGHKVDTIVSRAALGLNLAEVLAPEKRVFREGLALGGLANGARQKSRTHCNKGHEFTIENTNISPEGWRRCRACRNARMRAATAAKRDG